MIDNKYCYGDWLEIIRKKAAGYALASTDIYNIDQAAVRCIDIVKKHNKAK